MNRRQALASGLAVLSPLSGCIGRNDVFGDPTRFQLRYIEILNWTESPQEVTATIEQNGTQMFEESDKIPGIQDNKLQSWRIKKSWMDETAEYAVSLDTEKGSSITTSTEDVAESFDLDSDKDRCLRWTFQLRADQSIGVFPNLDCSKKNEGANRDETTSAKAESMLADEDSDIFR